MPENFLWPVSKTDIRIFFSPRFVEGFIEGSGWAIVHVMGVDEGGWIIDGVGRIGDRVWMSKGE